MTDCPPPLADPPPGCSSGSQCYLTYLDEYNDLLDDWSEDKISCDQFLEGEAAHRVAMEQCCAKAE